MITAAVVVIGNEILSGRTQDANLPYIANKLHLRGIRITEARFVLDRHDDVVQALGDLQPKHDYVLTTGGIGPTHDDITAECIARYFSVPLVCDPVAKLALWDYYKSPDALTPARLKMAMIPEGAKIIGNPVSGAPGFQMDNVFVFAGVPRIMHAMLDHILDQFKGDTPWISETLRLTCPESKIASILQDIQYQFPDVEIGSYPQYIDGKSITDIVFSGQDKTRLLEAKEKLIQQQEDQLHEDQ